MHFGIYFQQNIFLLGLYIAAVRLACTRRTKTINAWSLRLYLARPIHRIYCYEPRNNKPTSSPKGTAELSDEQRLSFCVQKCFLITYVITAKHKQTVPCSDDFKSKAGTVEIFSLFASIIFNSAHRHVSALYVSIFWRAFLRKQKHGPYYYEGTKRGKRKCQLV